MLCVTLFLTFAIFLGIIYSVTTDAVSLTSHSMYPVHSLHSGRAMRIAQVDEVFDTAPLAVVAAPAQTVSMKWQWRPETSPTVTETQYIGRGVALIPNWGNPNSGRSWRISHL